MSIFQSIGFNHTAISKIVFICFLTLVFSPMAQSDNKKGREIAEKMEKANDGFVGEESKMKMILIDAYGTKTVRQMVGKTLEVKDDGDKSLMIFLNPQDVKGTKMLTWSHEEEDDDQWLYLPALRRVKRISSSNKMSSFMGSEFSYEDLGSQEIEKYKFTFMKDDKYRDEDVHVLKRVPKVESGYSKMIMYVSKDKLTPLKIEYFDRKEELLKIGEFKDLKKYTVKGDEMWRSNEIHMKNVQTKKESIFEWQERKLGVKHPSREFSKRSLR